MTSSAVLLLACPDRPGIVSQVSTHIAEQGGNILRAEQSEAVADSHFYQRIHFDNPGGSIDLDVFRVGFAPLAQRLGADWSVHAMDVPQRTAILVSRHPHCLLDLLGRWRVGDIPAEITAIISNHEETRDIAGGFGLAFHHLPVAPETKEAQEAALDDLLRELEVELVILARYIADSLRLVHRAMERKGEQHPSQLPPRLPRGEAVPPGDRTWSEADRCDRPLRHGRPRRGPDHRAGSDHHLTPRLGGRFRPTRS